MQRFEVFDLDDIDITSDTLDEDEERALNALPRDIFGMRELLSYLRCYDLRPQAWLFLFENYAHFMTKEGYAHYRKLALAADESLGELIDEEL